MKTFQEMSLASGLQRALSDLSFTKPTDIQQAVIPIAITGRDLMACAETGSGKTAAYGIPMVSTLLEKPQQSALILAPTRELVHQIADFMRQLTAHCKGLQIVSLVGGADMHKQLRTLKKRPRIIVATPGRLIDHLKRKSAKLDSTEVLILDEGDRMLDMGFAPQLDEILKYVPKKRQTMLFTATLPKKVRALAESYLFKPESINVGRVSLPVASVKQSVVQVKFKEKDDRILDELNQRAGSVIVFTKTQRRTDILARMLSQYGFPVDLIHGGRTQGQRNRAIQNFRNGRSRILCATDIAARGIDIPQVEHVINFDLPMMSEDYVHRIGRTARNGARGEAVSFVTPEDHRAWMALARKYKIEGVELQGVSLKPNFKSKGKPSRKKNSRPGRDNWWGQQTKSESSAEGGDERSSKKPFSKRKASGFGGNDARPARKFKKKRFGQSKGFKGSRASVD